MGELAQLLANGLATGAVIALGAVGVSLVYGIVRLVNFAHGDYLTFGTYAAVAVVGVAPSLALGTAVAIVGTALLAVALELALWRPLRRKGAGFMSLFIVSIGLALVLRHLIFLAAGGSQRSYPVDQLRAYAVGPVRLSLGQLVSTVVAGAAIVLTAVVLARTTLGKSMRALADDRALAAVTGIDVDRVFVYTWLLAGGLAGLAGVLVALTQGSFDPNVGFVVLLPIFAAVVLGGIGSAYGALVGGVSLGIATEASTWSALGGGIDPVYKPVVAFVLLVLALLVRPQGLFGKARVL